MVKPIRPVPSAKPVRNLASFSENHDRSFYIPQRIREGLKALGDEWRYEIEFAKEYRVAVRDLSEYREEFADHVVAITSKDHKARFVWFGSAKLATQARKMVA